MYLKIIKKSVLDFLYNSNISISLLLCVCIFENCCTYKKINIDEILADPFCFLHEGKYYLTGSHCSSPGSHSKSIFHMYVSDNLENWAYSGSLMARPEYEGSKKCNLWAPEIMFLDEKFYF